MHKIKLNATHTHAGEVHFAGHVIEVDETTAMWLIELGVGKPADGDVDTPDIVSDNQDETSVPPETKPQRKAKE